MSKMYARPAAQEATQYLSARQRSMLEAQASIEASDAAACESCGGEDCACCEIHLDRQRWKPIDQLLAEEEW